MEKRNKLQDKIKVVQKLYKENAAYRNEVGMQIVGAIRPERKILNKKIDW